MNKEYTSLGLMSGTSGDGIDASIIRSDGTSKYEVLFNKYYKYQDNIYETIHLVYVIRINIHVNYSFLA